MTDDPNVNNRDRSYVQQQIDALAIESIAAAAALEAHLYRHMQGAPWSKFDYFYERFRALYDVTSIRKAVRENTANKPLMDRIDRWFIKPELAKRMAEIGLMRQGLDYHKAWIAMLSKSGVIEG